MPNIISSFDGEYKFLSNHYPVDVIFDEIVYPSSEHAYVAAKTTDETLRRVIKKTPTAAEVKKYGSKIKVRDHWDQVKYGLMYVIVRSKFSHNKGVRYMLLQTGDAELIEGNWWGDTYWGVCNGVGQNNLGKILMDVRKELNA